MNLHVLLIPDEKIGVHLWNLASQVNRATPTTPEPSKDELSMVAACALPNLIIFRLTIW